MEYVDNWILQYKNERNLLEEESIRIVNLLSEMFKNFKVNVIITSRVKDPESLRAKIYRKNYHIDHREKENIFEFLKDGIGIRIMCLEHNDEIMIYEELKKLHKHGDFHESIKFNETMDDQPEFQKNGHPIYRIDGECEKHQFEVQIKSLSHMLWGEIEHMLFYKNFNCIIGSKFLKYQIEQIFDDLIAINDRILNLKKYMIKESLEHELEEVKEISRSILQKRCNTYIKSINNGIILDFRPIFEAVIDEYYCRFDQTVRKNANKEKRKKKDKLQPTDEIINEVYMSFEKLVSQINKIQEGTLSNQLEIIANKDKFQEGSKQYLVLEAIAKNQEKPMWFIFFNLDIFLNNENGTDYFYSLALKLVEMYKLEIYFDSYEIEEKDRAAIVESFFRQCLVSLNEGSKFDYINDVFIKKIKATSILLFGYILNDSNYFDDTEDDDEDKKLKLFSLVYEISESLALFGKIKKEKIEEFFKCIRMSEKPSKEFLYFDKNETISIEEFETILRGVRSNDRE